MSSALRNASRAGRGRTSWPFIDRLLTAACMPVAAASPEPGAAAMQRPRVLVVDDHPVNLILAAEMLGHWGIRPLQAADGAEAVVLAGEVSLHLILMDLQMPGLDGLAATRMIRDHERATGRPRVPVVAYTAIGHCADDPSLRGSGLDGVLAKPCVARELHSCLLRWQVPGVAPFMLPGLGPGLSGQAWRAEPDPGP